MDGILTKIEWKIIHTLYIVFQVFDDIFDEKEIQINAWYRIFGTEILSYEEFHCKNMQISEENELYPAKWK